MSAHIVEQYSRWGQMRDIEPDDGRGGGMGIEMPVDETNNMAGFATNGGYVGVDESRTPR